MAETKSLSGHSGPRVIHENIIAIVKRTLPPERTVVGAAELFKVLGDPTRVRIMNALLVAEMCVCDISALLDMTQSAVSHQLTVLKRMGLAKSRRSGKTVYYSAGGEWVRDMFDLAIGHISAGD